MLIIKNNIVYSDSDKYVHRINTETYFKKSTILPTDTIDSFEEVDGLPKYTREEYKRKVRELVKEKYEIEDEIALYRQKDRKAEEFDEYYAFVEECKVRAKEILNSTNTEYNG